MPFLAVNPDDPEWVLDPTVAAGAYGFSPAMIAFSIMFGLGVQVLFGFWARAKAEEYNVNPWVAFAAGFFLAYIGVRIVPVLRRDALFFQPKPRPFTPPPRGQAPPGPHPQGQPVQPPQVDADGYMPCPACGARAKAGRKACMACGTPLPQG
jgi:hypothetical protein